MKLFNSVLKILSIFFLKEKAIGAFNFMLAESRFVGAALLPTIIRRKADPGMKRYIENQQMHKKLTADK